MQVKGLECATFNAYQLILRNSWGVMSKTLIKNLKHELG